MVTILSNNDYVYSDLYIATPYKKLSLKNMFGTTSVAKASFYDKNGTIILAENISTDSTSFLVTTPETAFFQRFCYQSNVSGVANPIASVDVVDYIDGNKLVGKYLPIEQLNYNHELVNSREFVWKISALRTRVSDNIVLTNVIKVPMWAVNGAVAFVSNKLFIASSSAIVNPSLMTDITDQIESVEISVLANSYTIVKLKTPVKLNIGEYLVFAWEKEDGYIVNGSINPDTSTENKTSFLYSDSGQTTWNVDLSVATNTANLTPSFVCIMDEKYEGNVVVEQWQPRRTQLIATMEDFTAFEGATELDQGYTLVGTGTYSNNLIFDVDTYLERCKMVCAINVVTMPSGILSFSIGKYTSTTKSELRITNGYFQIWTASTKIYEVALGDIVISEGTELVLSFEKLSDKVTFVLTDGTTTITKDVTKIEEELVAIMWGKPFVATTTGNCFCKEYII